MASAYSALILSLMLLRIFADIAALRAARLVETSAARNESDKR